MEDDRRPAQAIRDASQRATVTLTSHAEHPEGPIPPPRALAAHKETTPAQTAVDRVGGGLVPEAPEAVPRSCKVNTGGLWGVDIELIAGWLASLDDASREQVVAAIELLEDRGPQLGRPIVDTATASRHRNMKVLRPGSTRRSKLRVLSAFDPERSAIMLIAGDESGNWIRWYKKNIPLADDLFDDHVRRLRGE